jgi:hypothetical protein
MKTHAILNRALDPDGKKALDASFDDAHVFRDRAIRHLKIKWNRIHSKQIKNIAYDSPSWSEKQAACNGSLLMIEEMLKEVFNVKDDDDAKEEN